MASLGAGKRGFPAFITERLQQIIECVRFEGANGRRLNQLVPTPLPESRTYTRRSARTSIPVQTQGCS